MLENGTRVVSRGRDAAFTCVGRSVWALSLLVWCVGVLSDFAGVDGDRVLALLTADGAAPGKLAGAALHHLGPARSVPRPAAHQLAAVWGQPRGSCLSAEELSGLLLGQLASPWSTLPLHLRPAVPGIPFSGSRWQKSGEGAR